MGKKGELSLACPDYGDRVNDVYDDMLQIIQVGTNADNIGTVDALVLFDVVKELRSKYTDDVEYVWLNFIYKLNTYLSN